MLGAKKGLLERLKDGIVVGDGSFVVTLERRGYVEAGAWTPEAVVQHPEAVRQLHREFLRAGADVMQTFTFFSSDDRITLLDKQKGEQQEISCASLNRAACDIARGVANEGDALVAGCLSPVPSYVQGKGKTVVQSEFQRQVDIFTEKKVDFLLAEFFAYIEEAEWAVEVMKEAGLPVACSMNIGTAGDCNGVPPGECAVRLAKAGASVVGINCNYDPFICLEAIKIMKDALEEAGLSSCYLMAQPVGWHTCEIADDNRGYTALPEFPFAMEPRLLTRVDVARFAREAYDLGVRYIGGCCGFEPYHIRAIAAELSTERERRPPGQKESQGYQGYKSLAKSLAKGQHERCTRDYWDNLVPASGRRVFKHMADVK